jgi:outer membrane protein
MKGNIKISFFLIGLQVATLPVLAQSRDTITTVKWTFQECIEYARENNIQLQVLQKNTDLSEQDLLQAKSARLPGLSALFNQNFTHAAYGNPAAQQAISGNYGVNSSWVLYQGGYLRNQVDARLLAIQQNELSVNEAFNDIGLRIAQTYLAVLLAKENAVTIENVLQTSKAQYEQGKTFYKAGKIARKDLVQLESGVATDEYNLVIAQNQIRLNLLTLKQLLQLPPSDNFDVQPTQTGILSESITPLDEARTASVQTRPEVKNAQLAIQQANIQLKQARSAEKPSVIAGAALLSGYANDKFSKYADEVDKNFYQRVGVTISMPVFNKRINKTAIQKSQIQIDQSKLELQNTKTVLWQQVEEAYVNLENAQSQYTASQAQLKAAEESYRIASEQLKLGAVDAVSFLIQKNAYMQAQQQKIQARYTVILNRSVYEFYQGKPLSIE